MYKWYYLLDMLRFLRLFLCKKKRQQLSCCLSSFIKILNYRLPNLSSFAFWSVHFVAFFYIKCFVECIKIG